MDTPQNNVYKVNILIANDTPGALLALTAVLDHPEYQLLTADSGEAVLRQVMNRDFAVILLDINMPGMDGFETAKLIRGHPRAQHVPIIFITAHRQDSVDVKQGYALGAVDYLYAPVVPEILRAKVMVFVDLFRMTERLRQRTRQLEIANKEAESFSFSVSHDLRAPLRRILGFASVLTADHSQHLDDSGKTCLLRIIGAAEGMSHLITDLLELARVSRADLMHRPVDLLAMAHEVMAELRRTQPERQVKFVATLSEPVRSDSALLRIVLNNLLGNAWKFTSKQAAPLIEFGSMPSTTPAVFFVRDNGAGFDMRYASKLFGAFQRMHSEKEFPGTGVGLATVQRIVHRHGGRVWAESELGKGTSIYFTLAEEHPGMASAA